MPTLTTTADNTPARDAPVCVCGHQETSHIPCTVVTGFWGCAECSRVGSGRCEFFHAARQEQQPSSDAMLVQEFWNAVAEWERKNQRNNKYHSAELSRAYDRAQSASDAVIARLAGATTGARGEDSESVTLTAYEYASVLHDLRNMEENVQVARADAALGSEIMLLLAHVGDSTPVKLWRYRSGYYCDLPTLTETPPFAEIVYSVGTLMRSAAHSRGEPHAFDIEAMREAFDLGNEDAAIRVVREHFEVLRHQRARAENHAAM